MISVLSWILFGVIVGVITNFIAEKDKKENLFGTVLLGVLGSVLGGLLGNLLIQGSIDTFQFISFMIAATSSFTLLILEKVVGHR